MIAEPMEVATYGRLAIFTDPEGAFFGIWEPADFAGAELVNEPGAFAWNELNSGNAAAAKEFYGRVFGWEFEDRESENADSYVICMVGGERVAGMLEMSARVPSEVPPHWNTYFSVADAEAAIEQVEAGGGAKVMGPMDVEVGRIAVVHDPWGAVFSVIRLNP
jgi:predicted enzyme related to lactoylglutathione lyase